METIALSWRFIRPKGGFDPATAPLNAQGALRAVDTSSPSGRIYEGFNDRIGIYWRVDDAPGTHTLPKPIKAIFIPYASNTEYPPAGSGLGGDFYTWAEAQSSTSIGGTVQSQLDYTNIPHLYPSYQGWTDNVGTGDIGSHPYTPETMYIDIARSLGDPTDILDNADGDSNSWRPAGFKGYPYRTKQ